MDGRIDLLHRVVRSTVMVVAEIPAEHPSVRVLGTKRSGSGTAVDPGGTILTANYVTLGATSVAIVDIDGRRHRGELLAHDYASGLATLRIEGGFLAPIDRGESSALSPGDAVFAVAATGSAERRVASGAVAATEPFDAYWEYKLERALWLTFANPGLGGGPVCDAHGRLVGVVSLNLGVIGRTTLAIPAENYYAHADELRTHGRRVTRPRRAWLGMFCHAFVDRTVVAGLLPGSPGERSGLAAGDEIVAVDGVRVTERAEIYERIWSHPPGEVVELGVNRDGELLKLPVLGVDVDEFFST